MIGRRALFYSAAHVAGVQFTHVPYRGSAPGLTDVMSGQIQGMFDNVTSSFELVRSGKIRAIGVTTRDRSKTMPYMPPISDTLPGFETSSFYGVGAPRGTPEEIVDLLNKEINAAVADPAIRQRFGELGAILSPAMPGNSAPCWQPKPAAGGKWWRCRGKRRNDGSKKRRRAAACATIRYAVPHTANPCRCEPTGISRKVDGRRAIARWPVKDLRP
jgi:hypothetical protein